MCKKIVFTYIRVLTSVITLHLHLKEGYRFLLSFVNKDFYFDRDPVISNKAKMKNGSYEVNGKSNFGYVDNEGTNSPGVFAVNKRDENESSESSEKNEGNH